MTKCKCNNFPWNGTGNLVLQQTGSQRDWVIDHSSSHRQADVNHTCSLKHVVGCCAFPLATATFISWKWRCASALWDRKLLIARVKFTASVSVNSHGEKSLMGPVAWVGLLTWFWNQLCCSHTAEAGWWHPWRSICSHCQSQMMVLCSDVVQACMVWTTC